MAGPDTRSIEELNEDELIRLCVLIGKNTDLQDEPLVGDEPSYLETVVDDAIWLLSQAYPSESA